MPDRVYNVLFLCTHNSARSIMAEALLNHLGGGRFHAFSAGSEGGPGPKPLALKVLEAEGIPTAGLSSKTWDVFAAPGAPVMDMVITVCDQAAGEVCPYWPGQPITAHWGIEDPSHAEGTEIERERAFVTALRYLRNRIGVLLSLPLASLGQMALAQQLRQIGALEGATPRASAAHIMDVVIYHNPDCGTSRNVLGLIRNAGVEPHVIEYLKTPPTRALLQRLLARAGLSVRDILREKGTPFAELGLGNPDLADDALLGAIEAHPILINRPLVVSPKGVRLCRPSEAVLPLLPPQRGEFRKEDGELVVDAAGRPVALA